MKYKNKEQAKEHLLNNTALNEGTGWKKGRKMKFYV